MDSLFLNNPAYLDLDDAYRGLANFEFLYIKTINIESLIFDLEKIGFVAIIVESINSDDGSFTVLASKGKHGPCFFNGKTAKYSGSALAALDDDNHVFIHGLAKLVCDKTAEILALSPYDGLINCAKGNDKQSEDGADDYEQTLTELYNQLKSIEKDPADRKSLFYPGPFKVLILLDGTIVHRGKWVKVPCHIAQDLMKKEGFRAWGDPSEAAPVFFQEAYIKYGSGLFMQNIRPKPVAISAHETDFTSLLNISKSIKDKLIRLIDKEGKYFILIGNEAGDTLGCCPSEEVTEANSLVRSGILGAIAEPVQGDACPVTLYGFKGELLASGNEFSSTPNKEIRDQVYRKLKAESKVSVQLLFKWILIIFIAVSMLFAVKKCYQIQGDSKQRSLQEVLSASENVNVQLVLFHNQKRCFQCLQMEALSIEVIESVLKKENDEGPLTFNTVIMDDPKNAAIVEQLGVFASTLVLVELRQNDIIKTNVLFEATSLYQDEEAFKIHIWDEVQKFLAETYE